MGLLLACMTGVRVGCGVGTLGTSCSEIPDLILMSSFRVFLLCLFFTPFIANIPPAYSLMSFP